MPTHLRPEVDRSCLSQQDNAHLNTLHLQGVCMTSINILSQPCIFFLNDNINLEGQQQRATNVTTIAPKKRQIFRSSIVVIYNFISYYLYMITH